METIELKDVMNQLPVADLVKNLAGVDKNGVPSQFTMENIAAVVGGKLGYYEVYKTEGSSFVLLDETSMPITCSLLISVSESQSGRPNLYSVEIRRAADSVKAPEFHVHVISGTYLMKLVHITEASGRFRLFLKKGQYTPVVWVKLLTRFGVKGLVVEKVTESEIADAIEINAE